MKPLFEGDRQNNILAVMKRSLLCAHSSRSLLSTFVCQVQSMRQLYGQYKCGVTTYGQEYQEAVKQQQELIDTSMTKLSSFARVQEYISHTNYELQIWLTPSTRVHHLPSSPEASEGEEPSRSALGLPPVFPQSGTVLRESRFSSSTFDYSDANKKRRLREKTSSLAFPPPDAADTQTVQDADEEAATAMFS